MPKKEKKMSPKNVNVFIDGIKIDTIENQKDVMIQNLDIEKYIQTDKKRSSSMHNLNADIKIVQNKNEIVQSKDTNKR
jgi:hypothetical protein